MTRAIRWGVCGTGNIARKFATDLASVDGSMLVAVASRVRDRAVAFAREFSAPRAYVGVEELASDGEIDVVYVATPASCHFADTMALLAAGRAVLCEKPFALDAGEAATMIDAARTSGVFLMEAMWSRFLPAHRALAREVEAGAIGTPITVAADFGYRIPPGVDHRLLDPSLGGGALMDLGVYPVELAMRVFGRPVVVDATALIGDHGVDEHTAAFLRFAHNEVAVVHATIRARTACTATISGTEGVITIGAPFHAATTLTTIVGTDSRRIDAPFDGHGLSYEAAAVAECLRAGETECADMPLDDTMSVMRVLDAIRGRIGLRFPTAEPVTSNVP